MRKGFLERNARYAKNRSERNKEPLYANRKAVAGLTHYFIVILCSFVDVAHYCIVILCCFAGITHYFIVMLCPFEGVRHY